MRAKGLSKENFRPVYISLGLLISIICIGILGFMIIENFSFIEAFFMTIITISTVGFGEVRPLSEIGQLFTSILIVFSLGIFAYAVTTLTRYIVDGVFRNYLKDNKVKNKIEKLSNHIIVCGYGRNGKQAVEDLKRYNVPVVIVDNGDSVIEKIREETDHLYIHGDATDDQTLLDARIMSAKALITALPNDADNLFVVLTARQMHKDMMIISRASNFNSDKKLRLAGATNVIMPDSIGGQRMAKLVEQPDVVEFLDFVLLQSRDSVYIDEVSCKNLASAFAEKTIGEWSIRSLSGANIIGLKTASNNYVINPSADVKITNEDQLFVLGTPEQISKLKGILMGN